MVTVGPRLAAFHNQIDESKRMRDASLMGRTGYIGSTEASIMLGLDAFDKMVSSALAVNNAMQQQKLAKMAEFTQMKKDATNVLENFNTDNKALADATAKLDELKKRKETAKSDETQTSLKTELDNFDSSDNNIQRFTSLKTAMATKTQNTKTASTLIRKLAMSKSIPTSSLSKTGQRIAADVNNMDGPGVVDLIQSHKADYGELESTFQDDLKNAAEIDKHLASKKENKDAADKLLNSLPTIDGINKPTDLEGIEDFYSKIEKAITDMEATEITGKDGTTITLKEYGEKKDKLDQASDDAGSKSDLDTQIAEQQKKVDAAKKKVAAHKEKLEKSKTTLEKVISNIDNAINARKAMNRTKGEYELERNKRRTNQNAFQKIFAVGKTTLEKDGKATYNDRKDDFNAANNELMSNYGQNINELEGQKASLEQQLADIEDALANLPEVK